MSVDVTNALITGKTMLIESELETVQNSTWLPVHGVVYTCI